MQINTSLEERLRAASPELIFFDVDGTLLNTEGQYSSNLSQQLFRLQQKGVKLAIASGRPAIAAEFLFNALPVTDAGLFCTGAEIYAPATRQHLQIHTLPIEPLTALLKDISQTEIYCECYTTDFYTSGCSTLASHEEIAKVHSQHLRVKPQNISPFEMLERNIPLTKLLLGAHTESHKHILRSMSLTYPAFEFAFAHFLAKPDWLFASVISQDACKVKGFHQLLSYHNVNRNNVIAFGDSHSDLVFLAEAGLGIAMGNANDDIKKAADAVTLSADDDGVAKALSYLLAES